MRPRRPRRTPRFPRRTVAAGLAVAALGLSAGCGSSAAEKTGKADAPAAAEATSSHYFPPAQRSVTPHFDGATLSGEHIAVGDLRGKVVVVNIWGSWCAPCRKEAPELARLSAKSDDSKVTFLGIDIRDNKAAARAFERSYGIGYPSIFDPQSHSMVSFGKLSARAVPTTYVLDKKGRVAAVSIGPLTYRDFHPIITDVAAEKGEG